MLRFAPRAFVLSAFLFFLTCSALPPTAHAQDETYTAPVVLLVSVPGADEPVTVTLQIAVPVSSGTAAVQLPISVTEAVASRGAVKILSAGPAELRVDERTVPLPAGDGTLAGLLATPTPQPSVVTDAQPAPQPLAGTANDTANLRAGPGTTYAIAGKAQAGDTVQVVGKSADGEWYKLAGGEWIAAFLVDVEGATALGVLEAPAESQAWPRYKMITNDFSFGYPPEFAIAKEEENFVTFTKGSSAYQPTLHVATLGTDVLINFADYDAVIRVLKTAITRVDSVDYRFTGDGMIDAGNGGVYLTGVSTIDGIGFDFITALLPAGASNMLVMYYRYGAADIQAEALPILAGIANSVQTSSSMPPATTADPILRAESPGSLVVLDELPLGNVQGMTVVAPQAEKAATLNRFMAGNAIVPLPPPNGEEVQVIELQRSDDMVSLLVRNNIDVPITSIQVNTVVRGADGAMLAVEDSLGAFEPKLVSPGEVAYGYVYFSDFVFPEGVQFTHEVTWEPAVEEFYGDLTVAEVNLAGNRFVGMLHNHSQGKISGSIEAVVLCFDQQGTFLFKDSEFTVKDEVQAGTSIPFQIELRDSCPFYLIFASGFTY